MGLLYDILLPFTESVQFTQPKLMYELLLVVSGKVKYFYGNRLPADDDYYYIIIIIIKQQ
jgi:hypothetical protein